MRQQENCIDKEIFASLKDMLGNNFADFISSYVTSMDEYAEAINKALSQGDLHGVVNSVHPMKSTSEALGALNMARLASEVESTAKEFLEQGKSDIGIMSRLVEKMVSEYKVVRQVVQEEL